MRGGSAATKLEEAEPRSHWRTEGAAPRPAGLLASFTGQAPSPPRRVLGSPTSSSLRTATRHELVRADAIASARGQCRRGRGIHTREAGQRAGAPRQRRLCAEGGARVGASACEVQRGRHVYQRDIVAIEQDLVELRDPLPLRRNLAASAGARHHWMRERTHGGRSGGSDVRRAMAGALFRHILQDHVDVVVKPPQGAHQLLVATHDHPHARAYALVDQFCSTRRGEPVGVGGRRGASGGSGDGGREATGGGTHRAEALDSCRRRSALRRPGEW